MANRADALAQRCAWAAIRVGCRAALRRIDLRVEGAENLPAAGPVVIAARHFHHLYDGCALIATVPRPLRIVVALDWTRNPVSRGLMTTACAAAGWPVVPRLDDPARGDAPTRASPSPGRLHGAVRECVALLRAGGALLVFPEAYPTIDPGFTPKTDDHEVLPFRAGFVRIAALAERDGRTRVPILPAGLEYARGNRWSLTLRFGQPVRLSGDVAHEDLVRAVEDQVRVLSGLLGDGIGQARPIPVHAAEPDAPARAG